MLGCFAIKVVHDNIGTASGEQERVSRKEAVTGVPIVRCGKHDTYALPSPPPAPVTTTMWPLNDSDILLDQLWVGCKFWYLCLPGQTL